MAACSDAIRRIGLLFPVLVLGGMLAGCDDGDQPPPPTGVAAAPPAVPPAAPPSVEQATVAQVAPSAPASSADSGDAGQSATLLPNDPSAPTNTPLCGTAAQEYTALTRQLMPRQYAEAGQCSAYACYDAATATYIGADGYRHVCR